MAKKGPNESRGFIIAVLLVLFLVMIVSYLQPATTGGLVSSKTLKQQPYYPTSSTSAMTGGKQAKDPAGAYAEGLLDPGCLSDKDCDSTYKCTGKKSCPLSNGQCVSGSIGPFRHGERVGASACKYDTGTCSCVEGQCGATCDSDVDCDKNNPNLVGLIKCDTNSKCGCYWTITDPLI